jgi:20S proteasome subunit alpha 1
MSGREGNFDRQITIFSPQGHLYQIGSPRHCSSAYVILIPSICVFVEYCIKASVSGGNTAVAVRGEQCSVVITQKKVPVSHQSQQMCFRSLLIAQDRLIDPTSVTSVFRITDSIGCAVLGSIRKLTLHYQGAC